MEAYIKHLTDHHHIKLLYGHHLLSHRICHIDVIYCHIVIIYHWIDIVIYMFIITLCNLKATDDHRLGLGLLNGAPLTCSVVMGSVATYLAYSITTSFYQKSTLP